jgi:hypothetical protein
VVKSLARGFLIVFVLMARDVRAADWAQFRGPAGLGVATDARVPTTWSPSNNVAWKTDLPGAGTSSPIVVADHIYLTCYRDAGRGGNIERQIVCLDRKSGRIVWSREAPSKLPEQANIREGHGYASNTPVADAERVYVFFGKSGVLAFDHAGSPQWQADVGSGLNGWGSAASPVLYGDLVIVNASVESSSLVALDRRTGKEVWRAGGVRESWNTPVLVRSGTKTELIVAIHGKVLGFDPDTGKPLWNCTTDIPWYMVPSLVAHEGVVYCIGGRQGGGALAVRVGGRGDVTSTHRLWKLNKGSNVSSPIVHDGHVYWASEGTGIVYCAEAKTGEIVYEERLDRAGQIYASPILAAGNLYYTTRNGRTYVVAARPQFHLIATNDLNDRSTFNASPAVADGRLLVRSDKAVYCIGTK